MSDIIRRKLDQAKQEISRLEAMANKPEPVIRKTQSKVPPIPEPTDIKPRDDRVPYLTEPGPKMKKKWKQV
tara:strand:+ start:931 stop:1143 length:213 start_codon:yes stop_codon:yes gene_type:complete